MKFPSSLLTITILLAGGAGHALSQSGVPGEFSALGSYESGDYGTGEDSATQKFLLRFVTGDEFQFRIDVPFLRAETSAGFVRLPGGVSPDRGRFQQGGGGSPGGGGGMALPALLDEEPVIESDTVWTSGLGDVEVALARRLLGGGVKVFRLDAAVSAKVPTADDADYLGTGEWDYRLGLAGEYRFWSATGFGGAGWTLYGDPDGYDLEDGMDLYLGVESDPVFDGRALVSGWIETRQEIVAGAGARTVAGLALRTLGRRSWRLGGRIGLSDAAEDFALTFGVSWGVSTGASAVRGASR